MWVANFIAAWLVLGVLLNVAQTRGAPEQTLRWVEAIDRTALCNDRTRAGYFISRNLDLSDPASNKWVIFLESGGLCFSNDTCNRRFFNTEVQARYNAVAPNSGAFGGFDPQIAWDDTVNNPDNPQPPVAVINPLMSSMQCYRNYTSYFPNNFELTGTDILDRDPLKNKLFPNHNHVIIPYCSSDLWLGNETGGEECSCFNFTCNNFNPSSEGLGQFTFRGMRIFRSIFQQLISNHNLSEATELVLVGSSVGGVGVINQAKWVQEQLLGTGIELLVLFDSAWFINFQDNFLHVFGTMHNEDSANQTDTPVQLFDVLQSHPPCNDFSQGVSCCLSTHCIFTQVDGNGDPLYFPSGVRAFAISSVYDSFILAPSAQQVYDMSVEHRRNAPPSSQGTTPFDGMQQDLGFDFTINFLRVIREYGGAMNASFIDASTQYPNLGFYLPQCAQHIYLATSTLWGERGMSVFGSEGFDLEVDGAVTFNHNVKNGRWNSRFLAASPVRLQGRTMQDALLEWYNRTNTSQSNLYQYRSICHGPYCLNNQSCPDIFALTPGMANNWPVWSKIVVAVLIVSISIITLLMKLLFVLWLYQLEKRQDRFLASIENSTDCDGNLSFPTCSEEDAISVSCLDLQYSVTFRARKAKDEKKDRTYARVLSDITESSSDKDEEDKEGDRRESRLFSFESGEGSVRHTTTQHDEIVRRKLEGRKRSQFPPHRSDAIVDTGRRPSAKPRFGYRKKEILKGISVYFNPGEMVAVMGSSGSGKTTFLDLLSGRRNTGDFSGEIYVNGVPMDDIRDWYTANTGYVLELATPYFEELTVRENVTLAAQLKLSNRLSLREKFQRAEQVLEVTGLTKLGNTVVGGSSGPGLSGGQKKRLAVALQLLKLPTVILLDEPTSELDTTASFELLCQLNKLADSNRTVVLSIHQPRLEIFHMFDRLVLLSDGKVAYHGAPEKCYEVFVNALTAHYLTQGLVIPELEDHNPADVIMDMLGNPKMRQIISEHYHTSDEPRLIKRAITAARWREYSTSFSPSDYISTYALFGARKVPRSQPDMFTRMAVQEARGAKRTFVFFLPFIFFAFGFVLGSIYLQQTKPRLIISSTCVFSMASGLFIFPAVYLYYKQALEVYRYERADGVGKAADLVLQGFIRFSSLFILPTVLSSTLLYFMLVNSQSYDVLVFFKFLLVNVALSQTWISLSIVLVCVIPGSSASGVVAVAIAAFTTSFFIPVQQFGWWWRWLVYINRNYYAVSSVAVFILTDFKTSCIGSEFGCFLQSGTQVLRQFNFNNVNPYLHLTIILAFTIFYLLLAIVINWARHTSIRLSIVKIFKIIFRRKPSDELFLEYDSNREEFAKRFSEESLSESMDEPEENQGLVRTTPLSPIHEETEDQLKVDVEPLSLHTRAVKNWQLMAGRTLQCEDDPIQPASAEPPDGEASITTSSWDKVQKKVRFIDDRPPIIPLKSDEEVNSAYLREGDSNKVWRPKKAPQWAEIVSDLLKKDEVKQTNEPSVATTRSEPGLSLTPTGTSRGNLKARQMTVLNRLLATQELLRETTEELLKDEKEDEPKPRTHPSFYEVAKKIIANIKQQHSERRGDDFATVVLKYMENVRTEGGLQTTTVDSSSTSDPPCQGPIDIQASLASPTTSGTITPAERQCTSPEVMSEVELEERELADPSQSKDQGPPDTKDGSTSTTL